MIAGFIPAVFGLITAVVLANIMRNKGSMVKETDLVEEQTKIITFEKGVDRASVSDCLIIT